MVNLYVLSEKSLSRINFEPSLQTVFDLHYPVSKRSLAHAICSFSRMFRYRMTSVPVSIPETLEVLQKQLSIQKHFSYSQCACILFCLFRAWFSMDVDVLYIDIYKARVFSSLKEIYED